MVKKVMVLSVVLLLIAVVPVLAKTEAGQGEVTDPGAVEAENAGMVQDNPNSSPSPMNIDTAMIPAQPGMILPPPVEGKNVGYEDITNVTMEEGSPDISTAPPGSKAVGSPKVEWTFEREDDTGQKQKFGTNVNNGGMTMEANNDGPGGEGVYTMPGVVDPSDARCGTTPAWKPGRYTVGNHSVRRVEYESKDADTGEPTTRRTTVSSQGTSEIIIYDTTPPALQLRMKQESSDAGGTVRLREKAEGGVDVPIEDGTLHQAILDARGSGFDETFANEGAFSFPVTVKMGDNDVADVGALLEEMADGSLDPILAEARTFGFHVFEDTPLQITVRASDNFSDYKKSIKFMAALVDGNHNVYRDRDGNPIKWDQTQSDRVDEEGNSLDEGGGGDEFFNKIINLPFYSVESATSMYEIKANYPLRSIEPNEILPNNGISQTGVYLLLEAADDNDCYPVGMSGNLARIKVPLYIHDITPVCEGDTGLTVTFSGRSINDTITMIEDPDKINHDTVDGPKGVKFIVQGAHLVTEEHRDEDFRIEWTEDLTFAEEDIISKTDFDDLAELGDSHGLKPALTIPENTRLQISVKCADNYTISDVTENIELENEANEKFVHWEIDGMQELDPGALESPSMVNFKFANYREGIGFMTPRRYTYTFKLECRDKAGNEIKFTLPIYVLDTKYQVRHIMEGSVNE